MSAPDFRMAGAVDIVRAGGTLAAAMRETGVARDSLRKALRRAGISWQRPDEDYIQLAADSRFLRQQARDAVLAIGLPLYRNIVDRAEHLIDKDESMARVHTLLKREFGGSDVEAS